MDKEKTKNQEKSSPKPSVKKWRRYRWIRNTILLAVIGGIALAFQYSKTLGWITVCACAWSLYWYEQGFTDNVVDEYELGYVRDGMRWMIKSWLWLIGICAAVWFLSTCGRN